MHIICARFERLDEMPVTSLFGAIGVYVLWSPRADVRPSYIGEGRLIDRFSREHIDRFGAGTTGYAAVLHEGTERQRKSDAEIVETILIQVGGQIDQRPANNDSSGKRKGMRLLWEEWHNLVKVNVTGWHPLRWDSRLRGRVEIKAWLDYDKDEGFQVVIDHPWRRCG